MIVNIYEKIGLELGIDGWEETMSNPSMEYTKAVWKKKGDVGDWHFCIEYDKEKDAKKVLCILQLNIGKAIESKVNTPIYVLDVIGVKDTLLALKTAVVLLLHKSMKGGMICQNL